jgi:hypothetical protein
MRLAEGRAEMRISTFALLMLPLAACTGDLVDIGQNAGGNPDMAQPPGGDLALQAATFDPTIESDINTLGCPGCHSNGQMPVMKGNDVNADYTAFTAQANTGENSPVLTATLAGSTDTAHPSKPFADKTNATYQRWLAWINAGNPKGP